MTCTLNDLLEALLDDDEPALKGHLIRGYPHTERSRWTFNSPLHYAATDNRIWAIAPLIEAGADVNARNSSGRTPLHRAVAQSNIECCMALAANGADLFATDNDGNTPRDLALTQVGGRSGLAVMDSLIATREIDQLLDRENHVLKNMRPSLQG